MAPLLRLVKVSKEYGEVEHVVFVDRQYSALSTNTFNTIQTNIADSNGNLLQFVDEGTIILGLHFRRKPKKV